MSRRPFVTVAVLLVSVGVFAAIAGWPRWRSESPAARIHAVLDEPRDTRLFEPRIGSYSTYRPFEPVTRGDSSEQQKWAVVARLEAERDALPVDSGHYSAASGLALLHRGLPDDALDLLREAVYLEPREPEYWSDLAAASLIRGRPTDALHALDAAEQALELQAHHPAATFNRALALGALGLTDDARAVFASGAAGAASRGWAQEMTDRAARLGTGASVEFAAADLLAAERADLVGFARVALDKVRTIFETELMPSLGSVCQGPDSEACRTKLERVRQIALAASQASADKAWGDAAAQLASLGVTGVAERAPEMITFGTAMSLFSTDRVADAAPLFAALADRSHDPLVSVFWNARYSTCADAYLRASHDEARACLGVLIADAAPRGYHYIRGKSHWVLSQISMTEGNFARAIGEFDHALAALRDAGDHNQVGAVESLRATLLDEMGQLDEAWQDRINVLAGARLDARRRHTLLIGASRSCLLQGLPRAALAFQRNALANAQAWGQPGALLEARVTQAVVLQRLGRHADAREAVARARTHFEAVVDPRTRARLGSELSVLEGELLAELSPAEALPALDRAERSLRSQDFELLRPRLERARGIAAERAHDRSGAAAAYARGVEAIERERSPLTPATQMRSLDLAWDMYERLIAATLALKGHTDAFAVIESARGQASRRFSNGVETVPALSSLSSVLPSHATVVYFAVLEDEVLRWTISRARVDFQRIPIGRQQLQYLVRRALRAFDARDPADALRGSSQPLYELVMPASPLSRESTLVIVPDGPLSELPFAALVDPTDGRYLIERQPVAVVPSMRLFLSTSRSAGTRFRALDRALVVTGRTGASAGHPSLAALPHAEREASAVASTYSQTRRLSGPEATPERFLAEAGAYDIVHFTGHAAADRRAPEFSRLFLAPSALHPSGALLVRDLNTTPLAKTGLVVLGACETGAGRVLRGEGAISLARPFLANGAGGVVQSLWKVADAPSTRLLTAFHRNVRRGDEPVIALQRAQLELLHRPAGHDDLKTWAAFQYAGGLRRPS